MKTEVTKGMSGRPAPGRAVVGSGAAEDFQMKTRTPADGYRAV